MNNNIIHWKNGIKDGIPICFGYFAVSFTFGILAKNAGLTPLQAVVMSATNLTSAGQFAALGLIGASSTYFEMAVTQFILNIRYSLMSCSISQKLDSKKAFLHRFLIAFGVTDEIFGVSVCKSNKLNPFYTYGLMSVSIPGWVLGTYVGVMSGNILPERIISALGIAIYGMFLAVIIPPAKDNKILSWLILLSMIISLLFARIPIFRYISPGFKIIILTILIAGIAAFLFPIKRESENGSLDGRKQHCGTPVFDKGGLE